MTRTAAGTFEKIASGIYIEGLAIDYARDVIWYSDVIAGGIHGVKPDGTRVCSFNDDRKWTGGVLMNADGRVLSSGQGGIMWNDPETGASGWLISEIEGAPVNGINEMVPDGTGGIFFGTLDIEMVIRGEQARPTAIYRLTADGRTIRVADNIGFTNGMMFDPVRRRFYCNDTFRGTWAFDVGKDLTLGNRRLLIEKEDADGMILDAEGNIWITGFRSGFLVRLTPEGKELERFEAPAGSITQARFGGDDMRDIYLNAVPSDAGDTLKEGGELSNTNSFLFKGRSDVPGMKVPPANFTLPERKTDA